MASSDCIQSIICQVMNILEPELRAWLEQNKVGPLNFSVNCFKGGVSSIKIGSEQTIAIDKPIR